MSKKWKIDQFFEKYLGNFYKLSANGKKELFGKDGYNHGMYGALLMFAAGSIYHWVLHPNHFFIWIYGVFVAIVGFFYFMEVGQEHVRLKKHNTKANPLLWFRQPNAQLADVIAPMVTSGIIGILWVLVHG